jgi:DNA processing protein
MDDATLFEFRLLQRCVGEHTTGLGALLVEYGTPAAALAAPDARLAELPPATQGALERLRRRWPPARPGAAAPVSRSCAAQRPAEGRSEWFLPVTDARYPSRLRDAPDPPPWLFCRGDPQHLLRPIVAIVGSRRASLAGLRAATSIAADLVRSGYTVCSGLALGIDAAAHRGALDTSADGEGATIAVLASGLDRPSPAAHATLARRIANSGCLVSELPPGTRPHRGRFPRRNRIISGLADASIIVEAALPSGSLHTAAAALEQGRDVFVLPWSIFHAQGAGCLRLLRDGATPITSLDDVAGFFPPLAPAPGPAPHGPSARQPRLAPEAVKILELVGDGALSAEDLQGATQCAAADLFDTLADLEIDGHLVRVNGLYERRI